MALTTPAVREQSVPQTLFLSDDDVGQLADWKAAVSALARAYASPIDAAMVPPRSMARGDGIWLRSLTAISPSGQHLGCKLISASMKARRASYLISLFDRETMALAALIDGNRVTGIRTAATAALAVDLLAPDRPLQVGVIGSGFEAGNALSALLSARPLAAARVYSPSAANRERFAEAFRKSHGLQTEAVATGAAAVKGADVVLCATRSHDESPVLLGAWLEPGMTVVSIGSTLPEQREVDEATMERARVVVADMPDEVAHDTGDAIAARKAGVDISARIVALADVAARRVPARQVATDIALYKSVGSALQDIVIAEMLFARACERGLGIRLPASIVPVAK